MSGTMVRTCVAAAGLAVGAGLARGQCDPIIDWPCPDTTECDPTTYGAEYLEGEEVWYPPPSITDTWTADRRPSRNIFLWGNNANYFHNPLSLEIGWWGDCGPGAMDCAVDDDENGRPDQMDWLLGKLQAEYDNGFRRIILYLPYGMVKDMLTLPSGQWWAMPPWRQYWLSRATDTPTEPGGLAWWINEHRDLVDAANDIEVSIYVGFGINSPCTPCHHENEYTEVEYIEGEYYYPCDGVDESHDPNPYNGAHTEIFLQNLQPWIDAGIKMIWLDASGDVGQRDEFRQLAWSPDFRSQGVKLGGEAFALNPNLMTGRSEPAGSYFDAAPFAMLLYSVERTFLNGRTSLVDTTAHTWTAQPWWEAVIWPITTPTYEAGSPPVEYTMPDWVAGKKYWSMYTFYVANGFTVISTPGFGEYAERVMGVGHIADRSDFNGDGVANSQDFYDFLARWNTSLNYIGRHPTDAKPLTFIHGDINNDGAVNSQDYFDWIGDFYDPIQPQPFTLGVMHWDANSEWVPTEDEWLYY